MFKRYEILSNYNKQQFRWFVFERKQEASPDELQELEWNNDTAVANSYPEEDQEAVIIQRQKMRWLTDELFTHAEAVQVAEVLRNSGHEPLIQVAEDTNLDNTGYMLSSIVQNSQNVIGRNLLVGYDLPFDIMAIVQRG